MWFQYHLHVGGASGSKESIKFEAILSCMQFHHFLAQSGEQVDMQDGLTRKMQIVHWPKVDKIIHFCEKIGEL